ncbi:hypothetical protein SK128_007022, partial [Halocaridina rubra]
MRWPFLPVEKPELVRMMGHLRPQISIVVPLRIAEGKRFYSFLFLSGSGKEEL